MEQKLLVLESNLSEIRGEVKELKEIILSLAKNSDTNFNLLKKDISALHHKVDNLKGDTTQSFEEVGNHLINLTNEISKISLATGYDEMVHNTSLIG